jgi:non-homologous end joining protein Ku
VLKGKKVVAKKAEQSKSSAPDLMAVLTASVEQAGGKRVTKTTTKTKPKGKVKA